MDLSPLTMKLNTPYGALPMKLSIHCRPTWFKIGEFYHPAIGTDFGTFYWPNITHADQRGALLASTKACEDVRKAVDGVAGEWNVAPVPTTFEVGLTQRQIVETPPGVIMEAKLGHVPDLVAERQRQFYNEGKSVATASPFTPED